ncbi:hypothetical protein APHAL10511_001498 [Amanita phalloides]|nr:hypothetical protein APHAL10511_001498 [Amanita phalloides]
MPFEVSWAHSIEANWLDDDETLRSMFFVWQHILVQTLALSVLPMAWVIDYLCCLGCPKHYDEEQDVENETTHLIPQAPDDDLFEASLLHQRKLDERLGSIIRSKEVKMVNVTSHLPFNLHNRVLPDDSLANSRSGSRSIDLYHSRGYEDELNDRLQQRRRSSHGRYRTGSQSRPPSVHDHQRTYSRPSSPDSTYKTVRREPIFNLRLIGYNPADRGRSMLSSKHSDTAQEKSPDSESARSSASPDIQTSLESHLQLRGAELICTSWGD